MYTGKQIKNEVGSKVSRQIDVGAAQQRMRMKDNRKREMNQNVMMLKNSKHVLQLSTKHNTQYNIALNRNVIQRLDPNNLPYGPVGIGIPNPNIRNSYDVTEIGQHPEERMFLNMMFTIGIPMGDAMQIWLTLLEGFQIQDFLNEASTRGVVDGQYFTNEDIRQDNELFRQVARAVRPLLYVGDSVGLWSGGFDLSQYAQSIGCVTLEESPFGFILDSLYLTNSWGRLGPLWNIISREFVDVAIAQGAQFHVFLRIYDIESVLIRQEIQQIRMLGPHLNVFWHPIVEFEGTYFELDTNCDLSENHQPCLESECLARLLYFHEKQDPNGEGRVFPNIVNHFINELDIDDFGADEILDNIAMTQ